DEEADSAGVVDEVRRISEQLALLGAIMNCAITRSGILDAEIALKITPGEEIAPLPDSAAELQGGFDRTETAAVHRQFIVNLLAAVLGRDVDDSGGAKAVLRGQRARDERKRLNEPHVKFLAEAGNSLGQEHVVNPVLQVGVLAADMQL